MNRVNYHFSPSTHQASGVRIQFKFIFQECVSGCDVLLIKTVENLKSSLRKTKGKVKP